MLKKIFAIILLLSSFNVLACWRMQGSFAVDGETWKIDQKIDHNQAYMMPMGPYIVKLTVKSEKGKKPSVVYEVQEKKGTSLTLVTKGEEENLESKQKRDIFAKGEEGEPNSIITITLIPL